MSFTPTYASNPNDYLSSDPPSIGYVYQKTNSQSPNYYTGTYVQFDTLHPGIYQITANLWFTRSYNNQASIVYNNSLASGGINQSVPNTLQNVETYYSNFEEWVGTASSYNLLCSATNSASWTDSNSSNSICVSGVLTVNSSTTPLLAWVQAGQYTTTYYSIQAVRIG